MINNKIVKITKANQFDKGWTLFSPLDVGIIKDRSIKETAVSDIVKLITFSNTVNLILTEPCLSSRIVDEIKWANKYIKLNLIAKNKEIIEHYSSLCFL